MIDAIAAYWNERIHDLEMTDQPVGTLGFFDDLDEYRFDKLRYLSRLVDFGGYRDRRLLEVGCGIGTDLVRFARGGARVTGVDLAQRSIELATANFELHGLAVRRASPVSHRDGRHARLTRRDEGQDGTAVLDGSAPASPGCSGGRMQRGTHDGPRAGRADLRVANGEALPFDRNSFEVVYGHGVLQYTADARRMVDECRRVLEPGGVAIFMVYNRVSWLNALSQVTGVGLEHADAPVLKQYSIPEFRRLLDGFNEARIVPERFPVPSRLHKGWKGVLYNRLFVETFNAIPRPLVRRFGWHLMAFCRR